MRTFRSKTGKILKALNDTQASAFKHAGYIELEDVNEGLMSPKTPEEKTAAQVLSSLGSKPNLETLKAAALSLGLEVEDNATKAEITTQIEALVAKQQ